MDLQRIRYRKNEAQEFRALTERLVGESGLDIELPYESPGVQHLMKYFYVLVGIRAPNDWTRGIYFLCQRWEIRELYDHPQ